MGSNRLLSQVYEWFLMVRGQSRLGMRADRWAYPPADILGHVVGLQIVIPFSSFS